MLTQVLMQKRNKVVLSVGVSIEGVNSNPLTSVITTATAFNPLISAQSGTVGTDGNQSIFIYKDGW